MGVEAGVAQGAGVVGAVGVLGEERGLGWGEVEGVQVCGEEGDRGDDFLGEDQFAAEWRLDEEADWAGGARAVHGDECGAEQGVGAQRGGGFFVQFAGVVAFGREEASAEGVDEVEVEVFEYVNGACF